LTGFTGGCDCPAMIGCYLLADSQPDTRSGILVFTVQPLKNLKNTVGVLLIETDTIVRDVDAVESRSGNNGEGKR